MARPTRTTPTPAGRTTATGGRSGSRTRARGGQPPGQRGRTDRGATTDKKSTDKQTTDKKTTDKKAGNKRARKQTQEPTREQPGAKASTRRQSGGKRAKQPTRETTNQPAGEQASTSPSTSSKNRKPKVSTTRPPRSSTKASNPPAAKTGSGAASKKAKPTKSSGARTKRSKSPFPAKFLAQQEKALRDERSTYLRQFHTLQDEADSLVADFEAGDVQFDEESGEGDTINIERERDLTLSAQAREMVEEIDHALAKLAAGTYGICEVSGEPIPAERLEAIPWARVRVEYKTGALGRR